MVLMHPAISRVTEGDARIRFLIFSSWDWAVSSALAMGLLFKPRALPTNYAPEQLPSQGFFDAVPCGRNIVYMVAELVQSSSERLQVGLVLDVCLSRQG